MEIANYAFIQRPKPFLTSGLSTPPLFKPTSQYLSTEEACELLEEKLKQRKLTLIEIEQQWGNAICGCRLRKEFVKVTLTIAFLSVIFFSFYGAYREGLSQINNAPITVDHSQDVVTPYYCPSLTNTCSTCVTPDGFWINQTQNRGHVALSWSMFLDSQIIAIAPPLLLYGLALCATAIFMSTIESKRKVWQQIGPLVDMQISMRFLAKGNMSTPLDAAFISKLIIHELDVPLNKLSFLQIKDLKTHLPNQFTTALPANMFSEKQRLYWSKLEKMTKATPSELIMALQNTSNRQIFTEEPYVLEALIQDLKPEKLQPAVKAALATCLQEISPRLADLPHARRVVLIDLISERKCSFARALVEADLKTIQSQSSDADTITLRFVKEYSRKVLKVSRDLLRYISPVLEAQLGKKGMFKEANASTLTLKDAQYLPFKAALHYVETGELALEDVDMAELCHLTNYYQMVPLNEALQVYLCSHLSFLLNDHNWDVLLDLAQNFQLELLRQGLDTKFECYLKSIEGLTCASAIFLSYVKRAVAYDLSISLNWLLELFAGKIQSASAPEKYVPNAVKVTLKLPKRADSIFALFTPYFDTNPKLLALLWDEALALRCTAMQTEIATFCQDLQHAHIYLANWSIPPSLSAITINDGEGTPLLKVV